MARAMREHDVWVAVEGARDGLGKVAETVSRRCMSRRLAPRRGVGWVL